MDSFTSLSARCPTPPERPGAQPGRATGQHRFDHLHPWLDSDNSAASGMHGALKCHQIREFGSDRRMSAYNEDHSY
jgi:hypothetical protein